MDDIDLAVDKDQPYGAMTIIILFYFILFYFILYFIITVAAVTCSI